MNERAFRALAPRLLPRLPSSRLMNAPPGPRGGRHATRAHLAAAIDRRQRFQTSLALPRARSAPDTPPVLENENTGLQSAITRQNPGQSPTVCLHLKSSALRRRTCRHMRKAPLSLHVFF